MGRTASIRYLGWTVTLLAALFPVGCGLAAGMPGDAGSAQGWIPAVRGLRLRVQSPSPIYDDPISFSLQVVFENVGDTPTAILPPSMRRHYRALGAGRATYIPYPGPPIYPWGGAFALRPGETRTVTLAGMRDGDGHWTLEPGAYELSVRYVVDEGVAGPSVPIEARRELGGAPIWVGALETPAILIVAEVRLTSRPQRFVRGEGSRACRTHASAGPPPRALPRGANRRPSRILPADCAFLHGVRLSYATHSKDILPAPDELMKKVR